MAGYERGRGAVRQVGAALALALWAALFTGGSPLWGALPDEMLSDPELEARARALSRDLRCPVCQGESIDESNAPISRDLRLVVRERLLAGDDDQQVMDFIIARYGEFVLFKPRFTGGNLVLWAAGPVLLLIGAGGAFAYIRRRSQGEEGAPRPAPRARATGLTPEEKARLKELLDE